MMCPPRKAMHSQTRSFEVGPLRILSRLDPLLRLTFITQDLPDLSNGFYTDVRPDIVVGQPFYLYGPQYPGGKAFNPAAFTSPPLDPTTGFPLAREICRGMRCGDSALSQWDFAVHREFPIHESLKLQFRAEMFNVLNHPNFGPPVGDLRKPNGDQPPVRPVNSDAGAEPCWRQSWVGRV